jgi:hypothetical protein
MIWRLLVTGPFKTASLTLSEALYEWCDPDLTSEFRSVGDMKFEDQVGALVAAVGPDAWKVRCYFELREALLLQLETRVKNGTLIVTGFSVQAPLGPVSKISADLWPLLAFDLRDSSARLHGVKITGIKLTLAAQENSANEVASTQAIDGSSMPGSSNQESVSAPSLTETSSLASSAPSEPRMVIKRSSRQVTFDRHLILMSGRSVDFLIVLAEALIAGSGPVSTTELKQTQFAEITADNAVAVAIKALRKSLGTDKHRSLVQTRGRLGYFLQLEPNEIIILP